MAQRRRGRRGGIRGNQMDVGEGVEANPPMGRNVGWNQNIEREDVIAELRRQVAALTEVMQRMQPPHETTDEFDDSHSHFENPFGAPPRGSLMWKEMSQGLTTTSRSGQGISSHYKAGNSSTNGRGETSGVEQQQAGSKSAITAPKQSQTATVGGGRQQQVGTFKCFKCGEPGHRSSDCRKKALMLEEVKELEHEDGEPIFDQPSNELDDLWKMMFTIEALVADGNAVIFIAF
nr:hypothetical protein CFP56_19096 [Quercus suber]